MLKCWAQNVARDCAARKYYSGQRHYAQHIGVVQHRITVGTTESLQYGFEIVYSGRAGCLKLTRILQLMNYQSEQLDISPVDFSEAPRLNKSGLPPVLKAVAGICLVVFCIMLLYGSLPEMSPTEIVASDDYVGEQPERNLLTLENLRTQAPSATRSTLASAATEPAGEVEASKEVVIAAQPEAAVSQTIVSKATSIEPVVIKQVPAVRVSSSDSSGFLPVRTVLRDNTLLKLAPEQQAKTLLSLGMGVQVTVFESQGSWIYVGTNDGSSMTGYVRAAELTND